MIHLIEEAQSQPRPKLLYFKLADDGRTPIQLDDYMEWWFWNTYKASNTRIARTQLDGHLVSTVFSGLVAQRDHVFETMIFATRDDGRPKYERHLALWLCATRDEAERQHQEAIEWLEEQLEAATTWNMLC